MGRILNGGSRPRQQGPTEEEIRLAKIREREQALAEAERTKEIQKNLRSRTSRNSGTTGRRSLLSNNRTGFNTATLRSLLGGS